MRLLKIIQDQYLYDTFENQINRTLEEAHVSEEHVVNVIKYKDTHYILVKGD